MFDWEKSERLWRLANYAIDEARFDEACELVRDPEVLLTFNNGISIHMTTMTRCLLSSRGVFEHMVAHRFKDLRSSNLIEKVTHYKKFWALELILKRPELDENDLKKLLFCCIRESRYDDSTSLAILLDHLDISYKNIIAENSSEILLAKDIFHEDAAKMLAGTNQIDIEGWKREYSLDHRPCMVFIILVCLCDGFFVISSLESSHKISRFLRIGISLPQELQMILVNRVYNIPRSTIPVSSVNKVLGFMFKKDIL